jgi:hypothetical protein
MSAAGKPRLTPLWFVHEGGTLYLNARAESPAVKAIKANPSVVVLLGADRSRTSRSVLKLTGVATYDAGRQYSPLLLARFALKYHLSPGGVRNFFGNLDTLRERLRYYEERAGEAGTIEFHAATAELITAV